MRGAEPSPCARRFSCPSWTRPRWRSSTRARSPHRFVFAPCLLRPARPPARPSACLPAALPTAPAACVFLAHVCLARASQEVTAKSGIRDIFPKAQIDDFVFSPQGAAPRSSLPCARALTACRLGYSMNGIYRAGYFTIHITPQPGAFGPRGRILPTRIHPNARVCRVLIRVVRDQHPAARGRRLRQHDLPGACS